MNPLVSIDGFHALGQIKHPEGTAGIAHANRSEARPSGGHGLPVVGINPSLDAFDLISGHPTRTLRKRSQIIECGANKQDRVHYGSDHMSLICLYKPGALPENAPHGATGLSFAPFLDPQARNGLCWLHDG